MKIEKGSRVFYNASQNTLMVNGKPMRKDLMKRFRADGIISEGETRRMRLSGVNPHIIRKMKNDLNMDRQRLTGRDEFVTVSVRSHMVAPPKRAPKPPSKPKPLGGDPLVAWEMEELRRRQEVEADIKRLKRLDQPLKSRDMEYGRF